MCDLSWPRVDRQGVNFAAHQFSGGSIDHPMSLDAGDTVEGRRGDGDVEMATFSRAWVAGVSGAVVSNFQHGWMQRLLQNRAEPVDTRTHVGSLGWYPRSNQNVTLAVNTNIAGMKNQVFSETQVASGRLYAAQRLNAPSAR